MKRISTFFTGMFTMLLLGTFTISALAITGHMTIDVYPINIQIDGEIFQPKDATGAEVPVFTYNGTTYAPLRALAEAYGLEVGYDAAANMATVTNPSVGKPQNVAVEYSDWSEEEEAAYQEFKGMWEIGKPQVITDNGPVYTCYNFVYKTDGLTLDGLNALDFPKFIEHFAEEELEHDARYLILLKDSAGNLLYQIPHM